MQGYFFPHFSATALVASTAAEESESRRRRFPMSRMRDSLIFHDQTLSALRFDLPPGAYARTDWKGTERAVVIWWERGRRRVQSDALVKLRVQVLNMSSLLLARTTSNEVAVSFLNRQRQKQSERLTQVSCPEEVGPAEQPSLSLAFADVYRVPTNSRALIGILSQTVLHQRWPEGCYL